MPEEEQKYQLQQSSLKGVVDSCPKSARGRTWKLLAFGIKHNSATLSWGELGCSKEFLQRPRLFLTFKTCQLEDSFSHRSRKTGKAQKENNLHLLSTQKQVTEQQSQRGTEKLWIAAWKERAIFVAQCLQTDSVRCSDDWNNILGNKRVTWHKKSEKWKPAQYWPLLYSKMR